MELTDQHCKTSIINIIKNLKKNTNISEISRGQIPKRKKRKKEKSHTNANSEIKNSQNGFKNRLGTVRKEARDLKTFNICYVNWRTENL